MRHFLTRGTAIVTIAAVTLGLFPAFSQTVGVNTAVRNIVKVKANSASAATQAQVKARVALGNDITTAQASTLQMLLLDQSSLTIGPNGRLLVDRFVYDPNRQASAVGVSIAKGAFRFLSGKSTKANPGQSSLRTPIASIGIRGTMIEGTVGEYAAQIAQGEAGLGSAGSVDPNTASMIVLRGPGPNARGGEAPGAISVTSGGVTVNIDTPGQAAFVPREGAPPIVFTLSTAGYSAFDSALRTSPSSVSALQRQQNNQARNNANSQQASTGTQSATAGSSGGGGGGISSLALGIGAAAAAVAVAVVAIDSGSNPKSP
ncbi:MAG: FecR domain-containing protein [Sphingomonadaceae bacterium]